MKRVIMVQPVDTISLSDACFHNNSIIAYETARKTGMAILTHLAGGNFGFIYHSYLVYNNLGDPKFTGNSRERAMEKVLRNGRTLIVFDNFQEFLEHSVKHPCL